jgi:hypothetical protein
MYCYFTLLSSRELSWRASHLSCSTTYLTALSIRGTYPSHMHAQRNPRKHSLCVAFCLRVSCSRFSWRVCATCPRSCQHAHPTCQATCPLSWHLARCRLSVKRRRRALGAPGSQFTCFTSTKVRILRRGARQLRVPHVAPACGCVSTHALPEKGGRRPSAPAQGAGYKKIKKNSSETKVRNSPWRACVCYCRL